MDRQKYDVRRINKPLRSIVRRALEIREPEELPPCPGWSTEQCETARRQKILDRKTEKPFSERVAGFRLRSIEEPTPQAGDSQCSLGPEFHAVLGDSTDRRALAEVLANWETQTARWPEDRRGELINTIERIVAGDCVRQTNVALAYAVYFTALVVLWVCQLRINVVGNPMGAIVLQIVPAIATFIIHLTLAGRIRNTWAVTGLIWTTILAAAILAGDKGGRFRALAAGAAAAGALVGVYVLWRVRAVFDDCQTAQLGSSVAQSSRGLLLVGGVGIVLPLAALAVIVARA